MPAADDLGDPAPLDGIRVTELSMYVQGPVAGLALASLGADVVKIEQVGEGDAMRSFSSAFGVAFDDRGKQWMYGSLNRNKRSLALDITEEGGRAIFHRLIENSDVFVTNLRATSLQVVGADPETLLGVNPRLIYCRGAGFALEGPLADDICQDTVGMAYAGFMDAVSPNESPNYPPGSMSDILTGTHMAAGVMAGLVKRARTGRGCVVGTSQTQALLWLQLQAAGVELNLGRRFDRFDPFAPGNPLFAVYETTDGWLALAALHPGQWPGIARAVGLGWMLDDPRYATFDALMANRAEFRRLMADHFRTATRHEWWQALRTSGAFVAPVNRVADLARDKSILANEYLVEFDDGFVAPPVPFEVDGFRGRRGPTADYAEHTDEVLSELGFTEDEILGFRIGGSIW